MDDQQGNLIDGTARARQWRRSRSEPRAASDSAEQHSDAPKSIASSLLVPAEMLDSAIAPDIERDSLCTDPDAVTPGDGDEDGPRHVNPFLVPQGSGTGGGEKKLGHPSRRRMGSVVRRLSHPRRVSSAGRLGAPMALALTALAAAVVVTFGLGQSGPNRGPITQSKGAAGTGRSLEHLGAGLLASNPLSAGGSLHRSPAPRPADVTAHRSSRNRSRVRRTETRPHTNARVIAVRHVAATSDHTSSTPSDGSRTPLPQAPSSSTRVSTATPASPAVSQHATNTASGSGSSGQRPAFGANGLLAPGSSPDS